MERQFSVPQAALRKDLLSEYNILTTTGVPQSMRRTRIQSVESKQEEILVHQGSPEC